MLEIESQTISFDNNLNGSIILNLSSDINQYSQTSFEISKYYNEYSEIIDGININHSIEEPTVTLYPNQII